MLCDRSYFMHVRASDFSDMLFKVRYSDLSDNVNSICDHWLLSFRWIIKHLEVDIIIVYLSVAFQSYGLISPFNMLCDQSSKKKGVEVFVLTLNSTLWK